MVYCIVKVEDREYEGIVLKYQSDKCLVEFPKLGTAQWVDINYVTTKGETKNNEK